MPDTSPSGPAPAQLDEPLHLSVHPSVVFKLGADLITDDVQALIELVKNAYDADSSSARIEVDTHVWTDPVTGAEVAPPATDESAVSGTERSASAQRPVAGRITVTDRGAGMSFDDIRRGWLTVSASAKRAMKERGQLTKKKRAPLGDKGLGRLGAQRLGAILEIDTVPDGESVAYSVQIPWRDYETAQSLDDVNLHVIAAPRGARQSGTTITVRGLRELSLWRGESLQDLERELSVMLSPYGDHGFDVRLQIDGAPVDLRRRPREVREKSTLRYNLIYANGILLVTGQISTAYFRPDAEKERPEYRVLVEDDNGVAFRTWLQKRAAKAVAGLGLTAGSDDYFIEVRTEVRLADLAGVQRVGGVIADPGPFSGEVDSVAIRRNPTDIFNTVAEYREFVHKINGIRVYRDGFGIRTDRDWLALGRRWTSGKSWYNLRPENVVGYIDLSVAGNAALVETTNREGFQDNPAFRNFMLVLEAWLGFTENAQGFVRRQWVAYRQEKASSAVVADIPATPEVISARARARLTKVHGHAQRTGSTRVQLAKAVDTISKAVGEDNLFGSSPEMTRALQQAQATLVMVDRIDAEATQLEEDYHSAAAELDLLRIQIETIQEQLADTWEAVSLGITAEALSHEVHLIADRLRSRSHAVARHMAAIGLADTTVGTYVEHVRSSAAALNRQLAHLNPALRYMRERRSDITLGHAAAEAEAYYTDKWVNRRLTISREIVRDLTVHMNVGKLTQVLDNLILNSEFWLTEQQRQGTASSGAVLIRVDSPCLTLTDTGPGVEPAVEDLLFEPFVTTKGRGRGRGLGLFVVRQLLDTEGASIELDPDRDADGRRRRFRITFNPTRGGQTT